MSKLYQSEIDALSFALSTAQTSISKERTSSNGQGHDELDKMQEKLDKAKSAFAKIKTNPKLFF